tara:strand:- start:20049 stop:20657 length:609 start_codon:yes stop_codon:yes gene_type:complete
MDLIFPEEPYQKKTILLYTEILGKEKISVKIKNFILKENTEENNSNVSGELYVGLEKIKFDATGRGPVDALYGVLVQNLGDIYLCFKDVRFEDFSMKVHFKERKYGRCASAPVEITLVLVASRKKRLYFRAKSTSLMKAIINATCQAAEFLINCELAVVLLHGQINYVKKHKSYMLDDYVFQLAEIVKIMSFEKTIKRLTDK